VATGRTPRMPNPMATKTERSGARQAKGAPRKPSAASAPKATRTLAASRKSAPGRAPAKVASRTSAKAASSPKKAKRSEAAAPSRPTASVSRGLPGKASGRPVRKLASHERSLGLYRALVAAHPDAHCELDHASPFQLIVATVLSAQATDVQVNLVTPALFAAYPTPDRLASAELAHVESLIGRLGMFRQKAKNIVGLARGLIADHGGEVPRSLAALIKLPGVGRKTANVVLGVAFGQPEGVVVDTHVGRLAQRLGFSEHSAPEKIEQDLMALLPQEEWDRASHTLIFHGRRICSARKPACSTCPVNSACPSAFHAEEIGRKPPRVRV
jgi:endonuclease-3